MLDGVRARAVPENSDLGVGLDRLEDDGTGPVGVEHAVAIVRVDHAGQGLRPHDQRAPALARAQEAVGLDDGLQPSRTPEREVVRDT